MSNHTKEVLQVRPIFDFELMLGLLSETRLGGRVLEEMADTWERWLPKLHAIKLETSSDRRSSGIAGSVARHRRPLMTTWCPSAVVSDSPITRW